MNVASQYFMENLNKNYHSVSPALQNYSTMPKQSYLSFRNYFVFILSTVFLGVVTAMVLTFFALKSNREFRLESSKKEAVNIEKIISESFGFCNKLNNYIGKQIAQRGTNDLQFILKMFRQADEMSSKDLHLLSWTSFDFVAPNNLQLVNSKIGIRKDPPDMSERPYCKQAQEKPWSLQISSPIFGDPSGSWVIPAGTGITNNEGKFLGTISIGFDIQELTSLIEKKLISPSSFVILDEDFNVILQSNDAENNSENYRNFFTKFDHLKEKSGVISSGLKIGKIDFFYYQKFDNYPYIVLTGFNEFFLAKEFNNSLLPIISWSALITLFFLVILYLLKKRILFLVEKEKDLEDSLLSKELTINSKNKLIRATSHDLRNYIFGISGISKLILENKSRSEIAESEDLKMVEEIHRQAEELTGFVEDLLDTNQNEDGEFTLKQKQVCNIVDLTRRMVILNKNLALENSINLELDNKTKRKVINVLCDLRRIKQVLNNLIGNAVKYSNPNSLVILQISLISETNEVCIAAIDQGIGMSESEIQMALLGDGEKISKGDSNKIFDSHGLGMPIVKKLIDLHKGRLEITSNKGYGTEVRVYLSLHGDGKYLQNEEIPNTDGVSNKFKGKFALIAEDEPIASKVITFLLSKLGFDVKRVENGEEILEQLDKQNFDLVFLDINMPKLNGFETAKAIREGKGFKNFKNYDIPIIAMSADKQELFELKLHGINMLLNKPFSEKALLDFVTQGVKL